MIWAMPVDALIEYSSTDGLPTSFPHDIPQNVEKIVFTSTAVTAIDYIEPFPALMQLYLGNNALNTFPDMTNITSTLEKLYLTNNNIPVISSIPPMPALHSLGLAGNSLVQIPDLSNISGTLQELYLANNNIFAIDEIPHMPVLRILNIKNNKLTMFPDLENAGGSLKILTLSDNDITEVPEDLIIPLVALEILSLGTTSGASVTLPNVCMMGRRTTLLTIKMFSDYITCDWQAVYTKLAERALRLVISPMTAADLQCASPALLVGRIFSQVTIDELLHQSSKYTIINDITR